MSDTKQHPYFPHYANARNEDNLIRLRMKHGVAGYGVYYMLLERLRLADDFQCKIDIDILTYDFDCDADLIHSVIYDFDLFEIVEEGTMFRSVELISYMEYMEAKKKRRSDAARAAAYARWGYPTNDEKEYEAQQEAETQPDVQMKQTRKQTLDEELEILRQDKVWLNSIAKENGVSMEDVSATLSDFKTNCIAKGQADGHKNIPDAMKHFRSWFPKRPVKSSKYVNVKEIERQRIIDQQISDRNVEWQKRQQNATSPAEYIRSKGYDPEFVTLMNVMNQEWTKNNPPTHPEWIEEHSKIRETLPEPVEIAT